MTQHLLTLNGSNRRTYIRAWLDLARFPLILRLVGFQEALRSIKLASADSAAWVAPDDLRRARHYANCIDLVARHHVARPRCLQRSLVLHSWLRAEGLPSELLIGVRTESGLLRAHAWVELGGDIVNDSPDVKNHFAVLTAPRALKPIHGSHSRS